MGPFCASGLELGADVPGLPVVSSGKDSNDARLAEDCLFSSVGAEGKEMRLNERRGCRRCGEGAGEALRESVDGNATFAGGLASWWQKSKQLSTCICSNTYTWQRIPA